MLKQLCEHLYNTNTNRQCDIPSSHYFNRRISASQTDDVSQHMGNFMAVCIIKVLHGIGVALHAAEQSVKFMV